MGILGWISAAGHVLVLFTVARKASSRAAGQLRPPLRLQSGIAPAGSGIAVRATRAAENGRD